MLQVLEALGVATKRRTDEGVLEDTALTEESIFTARLLNEGSTQQEVESVQIYMLAEI